MTITRLNDEIGEWVHAALVTHADGEDYRWEASVFPGQTDVGRSVGMVIAIIGKGPLIGSTIPILAEIVDLTALTQEVVDGVVRAALEQIRQQRSLLLADPMHNGGGPPGEFPSGFTGLLGP